MDSKTGKLTLNAIFAAFAAGFIYIASVSPTGQLGFCAAASLFVAAAVIENGFLPGILVYAASSAVSFFVVPNKTPVLIFVLFFGYYPIVKIFSESIRSIIAQFAIKLVVFNLALFVLTYVFDIVIFSASWLSGRAYLLYILGNIVFIIFDYGVSKLIRFYKISISGKIRRGR